MAGVGPTGTDGRRAGFTAIELLLVLMIAGALLAVTVPGFGRLYARWDVTNARDGLVQLSVRAKAIAMEEGSTTRLELDPATDQAVLRIGTDTIEIGRYGADFGADVTTEGGGAIEICYTARGFAHPTCTTDALPAWVEFARDGQTARAVVRPLGQVEPQ